MVYDDERLKVLKMVQENKLTAEEAALLLQALDESSADEAAPARPPVKPVGPGAASRPGRSFRVRVTDTDSGKTRVNIHMPVSMVNAGMKMGMRFSPEVQGLDMDALQTFLQAGEVGKLVDIYDDEDGEHVEVFIE